RWHRPLDPGGDLQEQLPVPRHFLRTRAWEERDDRACRVQPQLRGELLGSPGVERAVQEGVTHELRTRAGVAEKTLLEGENDRQSVRQLGEPAHPAPMPRPDLRRDVVEDGDSGQLRIAR